jgi:hypothetical protein
MQPLLPNVHEDKIQTFVAKTVDRAIALRIAMTDEQAIYRCFFLHSGEGFDDEWMEVVSGEHAVGKVSMCTFPGLRRFVMRNGRNKFVVVVKAATKLEAVSKIKAC